MLSITTTALRRRVFSDLRRLTIPIPSLSFPISTSASSAVRPGPPPIRVALTDSAGRGVFATRPIGAGDLIHTAKPILLHPSPSIPYRVCYSCLKKLGKEECLLSSPGSDRTAPEVYFCSERCKEESEVIYEVERKADWSLYDEHCRARGLKYPFMVKRLACMVISGAASADIVDILQPASLPPERVLEMGDEFELLKYTLMKAHIQEKPTFLTKQWYIDVLARIRINAFRIELVGGSYDDLLTSAAVSVASEAAVGNAVYMLPSFYNHDCGEELRICYIDASMDHEARQSLLAEGFGFRCCCPRCLSGD